MSRSVELVAADGHRLGAYEAGDPRSGAALVVLQEIFGVNAHIRAVADRWAAAGFLAVAPALFDRVEGGVELGYSQEQLELGRGLASRLQPDHVVSDIAAAVAHARAETGGGKVGVVGYCLGGSYAWLSAARLPVDAAVGYYGGRIAQLVDQAPRCPTMLHFGTQDRGIPLADVERIQKAWPAVPVYTYEAGHAFNRDGGPSYSEPAATLAFSRSLAFFEEALSPAGGR
jgi:carboxymethylenebutenolidase